MLEWINGSHRSDTSNRFEWWYFHIVTEKGARVNLVLHETDIFGISNQRYISMTTHGIRSSPSHCRMSLKDIGIAERTSLLRVGTIFHETAKEIHIDIHFSNGEKINGTIRKQSAPLVINDAVLYSDSDRSSNWLVNVPFGEFQGTITVDGKTQVLSGSAYQDHQWGSLPITDFVSDWVWGHFSDRELALLFFHIRTQDETYVTRFAYITPLVQQRTTQGGTVPFLDALIQCKRPDSCNRTNIVTFPDNNRLVFDIRSENIMRARIDEQHEGFIASYVRWASTAHSNRAVDMHGITEYLRIRRNNA